MTDRVLLDSHVLVWAIGYPERIPDSVWSVLNDPETTLLVSAATAWEIATKTRLGRMPAGIQIVTAYADQLARMGATQLSISSGQALAAGSLEWDHKDPFDRLLVAQAISESLVLVTKDRAITAFGEVETIW